MKIQLMTPLFFALAFTSVAPGQERVYGQIGIVEGQVFVANNPELGRTPASGEFFVFQRVDCNKCLVGVRLDIHGRYTVYLGIGKYRVYCTDPESGKDLIRKGQQREITVRPPPNSTQFNFDLEVPSEALQGRH